MADSILWQSVSTSAGRIVHEAAHDVESFIWAGSLSMQRLPPGSYPLHSPRSVSQPNFQFILFDFQTLNTTSC